MCVLVGVPLRRDITGNPAEVHLSHTPQFPFLLFGELQRRLQDGAQGSNVLLTIARFHFLLRIIFLLLALYFLFEGLLLFSAQKKKKNIKGGGQTMSTMIKPCKDLVYISSQSLIPHHLMINCIIKLWVQVSFQIY